jgi:hypothetical protein
LLENRWSRYGMHVIVKTPSLGGREVLFLLHSETKSRLAIAPVTHPSLVTITKGEQATE